VNAESLVFVVDNDDKSATLACHCLRESGYWTRSFDNASSVIEEALNIPPSLFLLETAIPGGDGFELCRRIRQAKQLANSAVIFLTDKSNQAERVSAFEIGGDVYIVKPVSPRELVATVRAVLRRSEQPADSAVARFGAIEINWLSMSVRVNGEEVRLTSREFRVLEYMARHASRCFSRKQILAAVWPSRTHVSVRSVDVYMNRLRRKIETDPDHPVYLKTVRSVGYRFEGSKEPFNRAKSAAA